MVIDPKLPHPYRTDAWNDEQAGHMNEDSYDAETTKPTGYQKALGALVERRNNKVTYPAKDSHSTIEPYV